LESREGRGEEGRTWYVCGVCASAGTPGFSFAKGTEDSHLAWLLVGYRFILFNFFMLCLCVCIIVLYVVVGAHMYTIQGKRGAQMGKRLAERGKGGPSCVNDISRGCTSLIIHHAFICKPHHLHIHFAPQRKREQKFKKRKHTRAIVGWLAPRPRLYLSPRHNALIHLFILFLLFPLLVTASQVKPSLQS
jgi:hypothetical protein